MAADAVTTLVYRQASITSLDGRSFDLTGKITEFNYYEDILKQSVTADMEIVSSFSYVNQLPIRGGEKVIISLETAFGVVQFGTKESPDNALYVYKVSDHNTERMIEECKIHLTTLERFSNESTRCQKKYKFQGISQHVEDILENTLQTKKDIKVEPTANSYTFIGNSKKPFYTLTWLGSKAISRVAEKSGVSGEGKNAENKGTAGFLFYENYDGYHFRSIDSLVANTQVQEGKSDIEPKFKYFYTGKIIENANLKNNITIMRYNSIKNIDLRSALKIGMYCNQFYYYDIRSNELSLYNYKLKDEIKNATKLGSEESITVDSEFAGTPTRSMFRTSDHGVLNPSGSLTESQSDSGGDAILAKSVSRINLLFTQGLNILIPLNVKLKVGDLIYCEFPKIEGGKSTDIDEQMSGNYVIREVHHQFLPNKNKSSLLLMRDSYGLFAPELLDQTL
tara:strand:+ start:436 stop:1788 length:1353 start_codon:yes stop_codon:yes gene_type:complete